MTEAVSYRNQFTDLRGKSMDWFLYDNDLVMKGLNQEYWRAQLSNILG